MTISEGIKMSDIHKPSGMVKTSGIYKVVKEGDGATTFRSNSPKANTPGQRAAESRAIRTGACGNAFSQASGARPQRVPIAGAARL
jgi:hypothetical protein